MTRHLALVRVAAGNVGLRFSQNLHQQRTTIKLPGYVTSVVQTGVLDVVGSRGLTNSNKTKGLGVMNARQCVALFTITTGRSHWVTVYLSQRFSHS